MKSTVDRLLVSGIVVSCCALILWGVIVAAEWNRLSYAAHICIEVVCLTIGASVPVLAVFLNKRLREYRFPSQPEAAARRLLESEERFRTAFEHAPIGLIAIFLEDGYAMVNQEITYLLGYSQEEVLGRTHRELIHPDDQGKRKEIYRELLSGSGGTLREQIRFIRKDGQIRWCKVVFSAIRQNDGSLQALLIHLKDETDCRIEQEKQRNLIELLEATPDLVSILDAQLNPVYLNRAGQRMLCGTDKYEIRKTEVWDLYPRDCHELITEALKAAIQDGTWQGEAELLSRAGDRIPVSQIIVSHKDSTGRLRFLSALCFDSVAVAAGPNSMGIIMTGIHARPAVLTDTA